MTIRDGYEYMQLVFRLQQKDSSDATIGEHWEAVAVAPDDSHRAIAVKSEDTEIRRWWWDAPHPEISKYLTEYGAEGWQLVSENVDGGSVPKSFRFVMARPKAPPTAGSTVGTVADLSRRAARRQLPSLDARNHSVRPSLPQSCLVTREAPGLCLAP